MKRAVVINALTFAALLLPCTAAAQVSWEGLFAGFEVAAGFRTLDFTVADSSQPPAFKAIKGAADPGVNLGGHVGYDHRLGRSVAIGAEAAFGVLGYHGEARYSLGNDNLARTEGLSYSTVIGRAGWLYRQVMPYFGAGVMNSKNRALVVDDCVQPPCGSSSGDGVGTAWSTHWIVVFGGQFASTKRIAGRAWALRVEWMHVQPLAAANSFSRTLSGIGIPSGSTAPVEVTTNLPHDILRLLFDLRLTK